jgi:hypothetical protein
MELNRFQNGIKLFFSNNKPYFDHLRYRYRASKKHDIKIPTQIRREEEKGRAARIGDSIFQPKI